MLLAAINGKLHSTSDSSDTKKGNGIEESSSDGRDKTPQIQGTYQDQATGETGASEYNLNYIKKFSFFELRILNPLQISPSNYLGI